MRQIYRPGLFDRCDPVAAKYSKSKTGFGDRTAFGKEEKKEKTFNS